MWAVTGADGRQAQPDRQLSRLARGGLENLLGSVVQGLSGFAVVVLVARGWGAGGVGAFLLAVALFNIAQTLARLGADVGLVRFISAALAVGRGGDVGPTLRLALVPVALAGVAAGALLFAAAGPLAALLAEGAQQGELRTHLRVLGSCVPVAAVHMTLIVGTRGFRTMTPAVVVEKIARPLAQTAGVAAATWLDAEPAWISLAWGGSFVLALVPAAVWSRRLVAGQGPPSRPAAGQAAALRSFWSFSAPRGLAGVFQIGLLWFDTLLLGALGTTQDAGIYAAASRYLLVGQFVQLALVDVVQPAIGAALATGDTGTARRMYQTGTAWQMALAWPVYITLGMFAPLFLSVFGPGFTAGAPALTILCLAMLVATGAGPVDAVLLMGGRSSTSLANSAGAFGLNVALNLLLIPRFGVIGAALAWFAALAFRNLVPLLQVARAFALHPFGRGWRVVALGAVLFLATELVVRLVLGVHPAALVAGTLLAGCAYAAFLWRYRRWMELPSLMVALRPGGRGRAAAAAAATSGEGAVAGVSQEG